MKYVIGMDSGGIIYITKFHDHWFSHSEVDGGSIHIRTQTQTGRYHLSLFYFFK
jgi:hypothetical protein